MLLQIGVKYCGGCQETYDRIQSFHRIQNACHGFAAFSPIQRNTTYDFLLVICGCTTQCPDLSHLYAKSGSIQICRSSDIEPTIQKIKALSKNLQSQ